MGHRTSNLEEDECWDLLAGTSIGRLGLSLHNDPEIYPINFRVWERRILLHTVEGAKYSIIRVNSRAALEADGRSPRTVWSVLAKGSVRELTDAAEVEAARAQALRTWTAVPKTSYFVFEPDEITGRRIGIGEEPA